MLIAASVSEDDSTRFTRQYWIAYFHINNVHLKIHFYLQVGSQLLMGRQFLGAVHHQGIRLIGVMQGLAHSTPPYTQASVSLAHVVSNGNLKWLGQNFPYEVLLLKEKKNLQQIQSQYYILCHGKMSSSWIYHVL